MSDSGYQRWSTDGDGNKYRCTSGWYNDDTCVTKYPNKTCSMSYCGKKCDCCSLGDDGEVDGYDCRTAGCDPEFGSQWGTCDPAPVPLQTITSAPPTKTEKSFKTQYGLLYGGGMGDNLKCKAATPTLHAQCGGGHGTIDLTPIGDENHKCGIMKFDPSYIVCRPARSGTVYISCAGKKDSDRTLELALINSRSSCRNPSWKASNSGHFLVLKTLCDEQVGWVYDNDAYCSGTKETLSSGTPYCYSNVTCWGDCSNPLPDLRMSSTAFASGECTKVSEVPPPRYLKKNESLDGNEDNISSAISARLNSSTNLLRSDHDMSLYENISEGNAGLTLSVFTVGAIIILSAVVAVAFDLARRNRNKAMRAEVHQQFSSTEVGIYLGDCD